MKTHIRFGEYDEFTLVDELTAVEVIAAGRSVRARRRLQRLYGGRTWRKMKGLAHVELPNGRIRFVELHWYESHGVGRQEFKIKRYLSEE